MHFAFAIPDPAETGSGGGTDYVEGLAQGLRTLGHRVDLPTGAYPRFPEGDVRIVVDGMVLPRLRHRLDELVARRAAALVHHVAAAAGRDAGARVSVHALEAEMLPRLRRVVATSEPVADRIANEFGVAATVLTPGMRDLPRSEPGADAPLVLSVGVLTRRKGHDRLLRTVARLPDLPWHLAIAGDAAREPSHAAELLALVDELGLTRRVDIVPDPDRAELDALWRHASLFALATTWEGYPSSVAEALRRGIPPVVTEASAASRLAPASACVVVPTDDMPTFGKCLRRLLHDADLRRDMADAAWRAGRALPSWPQQAAEFITRLED